MFCKRIGVFVKTPANLSDIGRFNGVEIEIEVEVLKEQKVKRVVFDGVELCGRTESDMHCTKVGG